MVETCESCLPVTKELRKSLLEYSYLFDDIAKQTTIEFINNDGSAETSSLDHVAEELLTARRYLTEYKKRSQTLEKQWTSVITERDAAKKEAAFYKNRLNEVRFELVDTLQDADLRILAFCADSGNGTNSTAAVKALEHSMRDISELRKKLLETEIAREETLMDLVSLREKSKVFDLLNNDKVQCLDKLQSLQQMCSIESVLDLQKTVRRLECELSLSEGANRHMAQLLASNQLGTSSQNIVTKNLDPIDNIKLDVIVNSDMNKYTQRQQQNSIVGGIQNNSDFEDQKRYRQQDEGRNISRQHQSLHDSNENLPSELVYYDSMQRRLSTAARTTSTTRQHISNLNSGHPSNQEFDVNEGHHTRLVFQKNQNQQLLHHITPNQSKTPNYPTVYRDQTQNNQYHSSNKLPAYTNLGDSGVVDWASAGKGTSSTSSTPSLSPNKEFPQQQQSSSDHHHLNQRSVKSYIAPQYRPSIKMDREVNDENGSEFEMIFVPHR